MTATEALQVTKEAIDKQQKAPLDHNFMRRIKEAAEQGRTTAVLHNLINGHAYIQNQCRLLIKLGYKTEWQKLPVNSDTYRLSISW